MAKSAGRRKTKAGKKESRRPKASRPQGSLKTHGDKLAQAVRAAVDKPPRRNPQ